MTSIAQRVLDALWDDAPQSIQELSDRFKDAPDPLTRTQVRYGIQQLVRAGKVGINDRIGGRATQFSPTGSRVCALSRDDIIHMVIEAYHSGQSFDQGQLARELGISHDAARDAMQEMRRTGLAVKTTRTGSCRLMRYRLDPRKAAIF